MKRILVIATRQIGDVFLSTPLIRAARLRWPQARIEVLGFAGSMGMLQGNPDVDAVLETPARLGWRGFWRLLRLHGRRYDLALVTQPSDRAHLIGWVAARQRSGLLPARSASNWWKRALLHHAVRQVDDRGDVHVVAEKLRLLEPWTSGEAPLPRLVPPAPAPLPADLAPLLRPDAVVLHAPSMWPYKSWPMASYRAVARSLLDAGHQVLLTGSAGDREGLQPLCELGQPPAVLNLAGRLDFAQLASLLSRARLYIGPDTSVSHLAAAVGIPVLTVFGPTNPMRWGPWPSEPESLRPYVRAGHVQRAGNVTLVQGRQACVPCGRAGCEDHRQSRSDCLPSISPELVQELALQRLRGGGGDPA